MSLITVDTLRCIRCGACVNVCPKGLLTLNEDTLCGEHPENCIACGHCVAVCPTAALDNVYSPLKHQTEVPEALPLAKYTAEGFLRYRRSTRAYKDIPVPREMLLELVNIARYAPTGHNSQGISFVIVDNKAVIEQARVAVIKGMQNDADLRQQSENYSKMFSERGRDAIFRGAPCLILATADLDFVRARENALFSLAYIELYAPSLGLGTCWAGYAERFALKEKSPFYDLFKIQPGKKIAGIVMVGYPQYRFQRFTERNQPNICFYE